MHSKLKDIALTSFRNYPNGTNKPDNLSSNEFTALKNLANNNNLVIQKADKGNCIVILDKDVYLQNVESIISDTTKFEPVTFSKDEVIHMISMETKIRNALIKLEKCNKISKKELNNLLPIGIKTRSFIRISQSTQTHNWRLPPITTNIVCYWDSNV